MFLGEIRNNLPFVNHTMLKNTLTWKKESPNSNNKIKACNLFKQFITLLRVQCKKYFNVVLTQHLCNFYTNFRSVIVKTIYKCIIHVYTHELLDL